MGLGGGQHRGDVHDQVDAVLGHHLQGGAEGALHIVGPGHLDPAALLIGTPAGRVGVGAVPPVDGHAVALGDKAHDVVSGDRGAAFGELHQAVAEALHDDALFTVGALGHGGAGDLGVTLHGHLRLALHLVLVEDALDILPDAADDLQAADAAVADGGVQIVQTPVGELFQDTGQVFVVGKLLQGHAAALELRLEGGAARDHVLVPALPLEPLADLGPGVAGPGDLHPVAAGPVGGLGGDHLHDVAVFQPEVKGHDAPVDLGGHHVVAHGGVDVIGKVNGRGPGGQVDHVAPGGEYEHLVGEHVHLQGVDKLLGIGALLILQQTPDPLIPALVAAALAVLLILPVGGDAVFGHLVHLLGADLHLERDAVLAHDGGVEALVHIGLGGADIVLEPAQHGLVQVVDNTQNVIAVGHRVHDDPEGEQIIHIIQGLVLGVHLAIDGIGVLHAAIDIAVDMGLLQALGDLVVDGGHEAVVLRGLLVQRVHDLPVADGVQVFQGQVLQLPLHFLHAQPVGNGRIDLQSLKGLLLLLFRSLVLHGAHIVQPVGDLDEDDPDVLGHGQQHFAQIFHLLLGLGGIVDPGQLADPLHQVRHRRGELLGDVLVGGGGVLNGVVEQGRLDGLGVQVQLLRHDLGHSQGMGDEG